LKIGGIDLQRTPALIAEIGNNHEGDAAAAWTLAERALDCGAHVVKFQIINPARLVSADQIDRLRQLARFCLPPSVFEKIAARVRSRGGLFMVSAFDLDSLARMLPMLDAVKIASGDLDFDPLIAAAARSGKPVVLSTGMATLDEIEHAVGAFRAALPDGTKLAERLALLHCVSLYPTSPEQANLGAMQTLRERFGLVTGYSDHVMGIEVAAMALGMGAQLIEKHFTLDKATSSFRDHALSADPAEFGRLGALVRQAGAVRGSGSKDRSIADRTSAAAVRRRIVAARDLPPGTVLSAEDIDFVRPGTGISPRHADQVVGRRLRRTLRAHESIRLEDLD
jgi:N,N'-diacetyllegionaminate synthase